MNLRTLLARSLAVIAASTCFALGCSEIIGADFGEKEAPPTEAGTGGGNTGGTGGLAECTIDEDCATKFLEGPSKCVNGQCVAECQTTAECKTKFPGDPHACIEGACIQLISEDCKDIYPTNGWEAENAIFLGVMEDRSSPEWEADQIEYYVESFKLARDQVEENIVGPGPAGAQRKIVLLLCDEMNDSVRAAEHLAQEVKVPVIFGPSKDENQNKVVEQVLKDAGTSTVMLARHAFNEVLQFPRAFSMTPSATLRALSLAALMEEAEPDLRTRLGKLPTDPLKVLLLTVNSIGYDKMNQLIKANVKIGGTKLEDLPVDVEFKTITETNLHGCALSGDAKPPCDYSARAQEILDFRPAIVIVDGPEKLFGNILWEVEKKWESTPCAADDAGTSTWSVADRPFYLSAFWDYTMAAFKQITTGCTVSDLPSAIQFAARSRSIDVFPQDLPGDAGPLEGAARYKLFLDQFKVGKPGFAGADASMGLNYDQFFLVAYALAVYLKDEPEKPVVGGELANVFGSLVALEGETVGTGSGDIKKIRDRLNAGDPINLQGIFSRLLFDGVKHSPVFDYAIMCSNANLSSGLPGKASTQTFDTSGSGALEGAFLCQ